MHTISRFCLAIMIGAAIYFIWWWVLVANQISVLVVLGTIFGNNIVGMIALVIVGLIALAAYVGNFLLIGHYLTQHSILRSKFIKIVMSALAGGLARGLGALAAFPVPTLFKDYDYGYFGADYVLAAEFQSAAWGIVGALILGGIGSMLALYQKSRQAKLDSEPPVETT